MPTPWDGKERRIVVRDLQAMSDREILILAVNDIGHVKETIVEFKTNFKEHEDLDNVRHEKMVAKVGWHDKIIFICMGAGAIIVKLWDYLSKK